MEEIVWDRRTFIVQNGKKLSVWNMENHLTFHYLPWSSLGKNKIYLFDLTYVKKFGASLKTLFLFRLSQKVEPSLNLRLRW